MGLVPVKAIVLSMLFMSCMPLLFGEETESLPPIPGPVAAPIHPPSHHHHKTHPPTPPPVHPPSHHHHHHKTPPPSQPPVHPPTHSPIYPPSHHHHHHKSPPPMHPPSHPPSQPPSHPPSLPPSPHYLPKRSLLAVQGVVLCKLCKYRGIDNLDKAKPLLGAVVKLECNNTKHTIVQEAKTDKNGYFFIEAPKKITTFGARKCKVTLISSPDTLCNKPTDLHAGLKGALLMKLEKPPVDKPPPPFALFSVGPFAFEAPSTVKCPP